MEEQAKQDPTLDDLFAAIRLLPYSGQECSNGCLGDLKAIAEQLETPDTPDTDNTLIGKVRRLVRYDQEIAVLKRKLDAVQTKRAQLGGGKVGEEWVEGSLVTELMEAGTSKLNVDGRTVYAREDVWLFRAPGVDSHAAIVALRRAGLKALTGESYNAAGLRSWLKERVAAAGHKLQDHGKRKVGKKVLDFADLLPPSIRKNFSVQVRTSVQTRKA